MLVALALVLALVLLLRLMPQHRLLQDIAAADLHLVHSEQQSRCPIHRMVLPEAVHPQCQLYQGPTGMVGD